MAPHVANPNTTKPTLIANINGTSKDGPFDLGR